MRRREHKALLQLGDNSLKGSRYLWLTNPDNLDAAGTGALNAMHQMHQMNLKTSRAWALKETAMCIWRLVQRGRATREWTAWLSKAMRARLEPVKKVTRMIRKHLWGIVNAMALRTTNAGSESVNAKVQRVKRTACGFRNRDRFRSTSAASTSTRRTRSQPTRIPEARKTTSPRRAAPARRQRNRRTSPCPSRSSKQPR